MSKQNVKIFLNIWRFKSTLQISVSFKFVWYFIHKILKVWCNKTYLKNTGNQIYSIIISEKKTWKKRPPSAGPPPPLRVRKFEKRAKFEISHIKFFAPTASPAGGIYTIFPIPSRAAIIPENPGQIEILRYRDFHYFLSRHVRGFTGCSQSAYWHI